MIATYLWVIAVIIDGAADTYNIVELGNAPFNTPVRIGSPLPEAATSTLIAAWTNLTALLLFAVAGSLILRWIYRVNRNAHALSDKMRMSPAMNVIWFFVPVANLLMPFVGIRRAWQASHDPDDPAGVSVPLFMRAWWGLWLAVVIIGYFNVRVMSRVDSVELLREVISIEILLAIAKIPLALTIGRMIEQLTQAQIRRHAGQAFA